MPRWKLAFVWAGFWLLFGLTLDAFIGTKQFFYLGNPFRRELWQLAHAHGVLLALLFIASDRLLGIPKKAHENLMFAGMLLMPLGFLLGGWAPAETDPSMGIWLVPLGGFLYVLGFLANAFCALRRK
jgi:hypothetical protein